jgi:hypothetical protein
MWHRPLGARRMGAPTVGIATGHAAALRQAPVQPFQERAMFG